ncbi:MAG TPA: hypothetical protein VF595_03915 [Tepidisphaeraceae bacterium]|jgi:hypothetical protein
MNATRSKVVIHDSHQEPVVGVAVQLLSVLGHDVSLVETPDAAMAAAGEGTARTDLLVLSVTDSEEQGHRLEQLALLPKARRPRQVAILSDADAETGPMRPKSLPDVRVHVFVKPVHALGLLNVIKRMAATN